MFVVNSSRPRLSIYVSWKIEQERDDSYWSLDRKRSIRERTESLRRIHSRFSCLWSTADEHVSQRLLLFVEFYFSSVVPCLVSSLCFPSHELLSSSIKQSSSTKSIDHPFPTRTAATRGQPWRWPCPTSSILSPLTCCAHCILFLLSIAMFERRWTLLTGHRSLSRNVVRPTASFGAQRQGDRRRGDRPTDRPGEGARKRIVLIGRESERDE